MLLTEPSCPKAAVLMSFVHEQRPNLRVEVFTEVENQKGWMIADVVENVTLLPDSVRFERYESFDGEDECRETGFHQERPVWKVLEAYIEEFGGWFEKPDCIWIDVMGIVVPEEKDWACIDTRMRGKVKRS